MNMPGKVGPPRKLLNEAAKARPLQTMSSTSAPTVQLAAGKIVDACYPRHRHTEFLDFLKRVAKAYPRR
jgi:hypothetical protein